MNPSRIFILRPVATALLMVAILFSGLAAYQMLPLSTLPEVDYPTIQVVTLYPGASPDVMTPSITAPLERQFGQMPGLKRMASSSSGGASVITLQFDLSLSLDIVEQEVQAAINATGSLLSNNPPMPPIYSKVNPADAPILTLAITSNTMPLPKLKGLVDTRITQKLSQLSGIGLVSINGGQRPAVHIQANTSTPVALGLPIDDIRTVIGIANVSGTKGNFDGPIRASIIDANDQLKLAVKYSKMIVAYKNGAPIRPTDMARIAGGAENSKLTVWSNTTSAIILNMQRQPDANVIEMVNRAKALLPQLKKTLPDNVEVSLLISRTAMIRASISGVQFKLMLAVALVVVVIFLFLHDMPATVIPTMTVPLSLVGTLGVMYLAGFSIDNLTLTALAIATGFVVDGAIVMIKNVTRYIEEGDPPMEATLRGPEQIGFTVISLTFSLIAVLIPLLFMSDVVKRLFREFIITLAVSILISAIVSLTFTPMVCARLLKHIPEAGQSRFYHAVDAFFDNVIAWYDRMLQWVLDRQKTTLLVAIGTLVLTGLLYVVVSRGLFPMQDTGVIQGVSNTLQSISFSIVTEQQQRLAEVVLKDPVMESLSSFIGVNGVNTTLNSGRILTNLKPRDERDAGATEIIQRLQPELAEVAGISLYMQPVQDLTVEDRVSRTQYQSIVEDPNPNNLSKWIPKLVERLQQTHGLRGVAGDLQGNGLRAYVQVDHDKATVYGIMMAAVGSVLYSAYGQRPISTIFTQSNQYHVVLETDLKMQLGPQSLYDLHVTPSSGQQIPLDAFATVVEQPGSLVVNHRGQFPATTILFNLAPYASLGATVGITDAIEEEIGLPANMQTNFQDTALASRALLSNQLWLILAAIITMYIVLSVLYENTIHPVTILFTLPSASVGALPSLLVSGKDMGIIAIIGIILLVGIVRKSAIMMIDFALKAGRDQGMAPRSTIYQACLPRFHPILMTTMAVLLDALPLMLGTGVGSELCQSLGVTVVDGLLVSQVLTLFTTPVIYLAFDNLGVRIHD